MKYNIYKVVIAFLLLSWVKDPAQAQPKAFPDISVKIQSSGRFREAHILKPTQIIDSIVLKEDINIFTLLKSKDIPTTPSFLMYIKFLNNMDSTNILKANQKIFIFNVNSAKRQIKYNKPLILDIILYPTLRQKLFESAKNLIGCTVGADLTNAHIIKDGIHSIIDNNLPVSKNDLQILITGCYDIWRQTSRNCGADEEVDYSILYVMKPLTNKIISDALSGNITETLVTVKTLDIKGNEIKNLEVYAIPVWLTGPHTSYSSLNFSEAHPLRFPDVSSPTKYYLPIADYYIWAGNIDMGKSKCEAKELKVRRNMKDFTFTLICK